MHESCAFLLFSTCPRLDRDPSLGSCRCALFRGRSGWGENVSVSWVERVDRKGGCCAEEWRHCPRAAGAISLDRRGVRLKACGRERGKETLFDHGECTGQALCVDERAMARFGATSFDHQHRNARHVCSRFLFGIGRGRNRGEKLRLFVLVG